MPEPLSPPNLEPLPQHKPESEEEDEVIIDTVNQTVVIGGMKIKMGSLVYIGDDGKAYPYADDMDEED